MKTYNNQIGSKLMMMLIIVFASCTTSFSQNESEKDKLIYHSFSITPLEGFFSEYVEGFAISSDLSYAYKRNIFTVAGTLSEEFNILGGGGDKFHQLNLLYGRQFGLFKWLFFDAHTGFGLFHYNGYNGKQTKFGFPLVTKLRFKTGEEFSIGFKGEANFNSIEELYMFGLLLQWNVN